MEKDIRIFKVNKNNKSLETTAFESDRSYQNLLAEIKGRLKKAQLRAAIVVNHELIDFIGTLVS